MDNHVIIMNNFLSYGYIPFHRIPKHYSPHLSSQGRRLPIRVRGVDVNRIVKRQDYLCNRVRRQDCRLEGSGKLLVRAHPVMGRK